MQTNANARVKIFPRFNNLGSFTMRGQPAVSSANVERERLAPSLLEEGRARVRESALFNEILNFGERERSLNELVAERMQRRIQARNAAVSAGRPNVLFDVIMQEEREDALAGAARKEMVLLSRTRAFSVLQAAHRAFAEAQLSEQVRARVLAGVRRTALQALAKEKRMAEFQASVSRAARGYRVERVFADSGGVRLIELFGNALQKHANSFQRASARRR